MELIRKIAKTLMANKGKTICSVVLISTVVFFVIVPFVRIKIGIANLSIHNIDKIVYARYEDQPFSSEIQMLKELDNKQHDDILQFIDMINHGRVKLYPTKETTSEMVFIYLQDGRVENAYIVEDMLGFSYGKYWLTLEDIHTLLEKMEPKDIIKVEELTSQ